MTINELGVKTYGSREEDQRRASFAQHFRACPIPDNEILMNLGLFVSSKNLSRILFMDQLYRQIVNVHGIIIEFGTRWGQNTALFSALRGIYEPFNRHRKVVAFDTFSGFPSVAPQDGRSEIMKTGAIKVSEGYVDYLTRVMEFHEQENPVQHLRKFELRPGDATVEIERYLEEHPETIVALAYFDFDLYEPTKKCLIAIRDRLVKGSIVAFDELNDEDAPGETVALQEVFGLNNVRLRRSPRTARTSYLVIE